LFAISASQAEIVELLAGYYGFDDYGGSIYEIKDGYFTGRKDVLKSDRKPTHLRKLVAKHGADWAGSVGVGDSESDIPMLSIVEQPIAFNPTRNLYEYAVEHTWPVVVERKNMIYKLEPENGAYRLETPD
jgi:phosphoserine phosphatase